jgi:hypothetical protein
VFSYYTKRIAMATIQKKPCSRCDKGGGIFTCDGCQQSFCRKHSDEHRQELGIQMDSIGQEHDALQRDLDQENDAHPLLARIDVWERESTKTIRQVAQQARNDLNQLIQQTKQEVKTTMNRLTNELQTSRQSEDYTEMDLKKWINQLNELRQELEQSINTYLLDDNDQKSIIRLIKLRNSQQSRSSVSTIRMSGKSSDNNGETVSVNQERFDQKENEITLTENGLVATYSGPESKRSAAFLFGFNHYSNGTHRIRFRIEKQVETNYFIGIVTSTQTSFSSVRSSSSTCNGWWLNSNAIVNNQRGADLRKIKILEDDEVTLTLDCDQKIIYHEYRRTEDVFQLLIDIQKCPLPWKIRVGLRGLGNSIRIID